MRDLRSDGPSVSPASVNASKASRWVTLSWNRHDRHRWITVVGLLGLLAAVAMAALGLPPLDLHGPLHRFGVMDPLCGGTRAAYYTARGEWMLAWRYNPLGALSVIAAVVAFVRVTVGVLTRRWLSVTFQWTPRRRLVVGLLLFGVVALLEVRQQMRADLLTSGTWMP